MQVLGHGPRIHVRWSLRCSSRHISCPASIEGSKERPWKKLRREEQFQYLEHAFDPPHSKAKFNFLPKDVLENLVLKLPIESTREFKHSKYKEAKSFVRARYKSALVEILLKYPPWTPSSDADKEVWGRESDGRAEVENPLTKEEMIQGVLSGTKRWEKRQSSKGKPPPGYKAAKAKGLAENMTVLHRYRVKAKSRAKG